MPSRSSKDHHFARTAMRVVEQAIGEQWDGSPLPDRDAGKNPAAVALGSWAARHGQRQFQAGSSTVFLVLQRQTDLIAARTREVRARADLGESAAGLDRATARTLVAQGIAIQ